MGLLALTLECAVLLLFPRGSGEPAKSTKTKHKTLPFAFGAVDAD